MAINVSVKEFDNTNHMFSLIKELESKVLLCGMPLKNDKLQMIALVQEGGKHIEAKNYPYLVIPTAAAAGRKTSEIAGLYQRGHTLGINDPSQSNGFQVMFILRKSIDIPPRPFMRLTMNNHLDDWAKIFANEFFKVMLNPNADADDIYRKVGEQMVSDMQATMDQLSQPGNAPLTAERKGFNNPLIDTKLMRNSICYMVINKE